MLTTWIWNHIGMPTASPGQEPRWADRNKGAAIALKIAILLAAFIALSLILSLTVFPELEPFFYGEQTLS